MSIKGSNQGQPVNSCLSIVWVFMVLLLQFFMANTAKTQVRLKDGQLDLGTLKCLSIGTPNTTTFQYVPNGK